MTTGIAALTDAPGEPGALRAPARPAPRHDRRGVADRGATGSGGPIADKAFDVSRITEELDRRGADIVIPQHPNRRMPRDIDAEVQKWRHPIENVLCKPGEFKRIAMRACETESGFSATICACAAVMNPR